MHPRRDPAQRRTHAAGLCRFERAEARQRVEQRRADRIDVGARIDRSTDRALLGRHVRARAQHLAHAGHRRGARRRGLHHELRHAEVEHLHDVAHRAGRLEEDVPRLHVAMDDPRAVRRRETRKELDADERRARRLDATGGLEHVLERRAFEHLHHEERRLTRVVLEVGDLHEVRMPERRRRLRLAPEPHEQLLARREILADGLQRDAQPERDLRRLVDLAHAPAADRLDDLVAARRIADEGTRAQHGRR